MPGFTVRDILSATGGELVNGQDNARFAGISIDSRNVEPGELFWAIKGERFDGNKFVDEVFKKGAGGFVTDNGRACPENAGDFAMIKVSSSLHALQSLAAFNRERHPVPLVGITGSNGKTTTKEILASILEGRYEVLKNKGNLNNLIGVPLTLLQLHSDHEVAVIEMGMNRRGEIRKLATMSKPDIGIITNIGEAHLEGLGNIENVKEAKAELVEAMEAEKTVVLNADDRFAMELGNCVKGKMITFGIDHTADLAASEVEIEWGKGTLFILSDGEKSLPVLLPLYGIHQLYNALAAAAAARALGLDLHEIRECLESYEAYAGRMEIISENGVNIINDSYNANPQSLRHAIETMGKLASGRKIAVLGDMLELGREEEKIHYELGKFVLSSGVDILVTVGRLAGRMADGAKDCGMEVGRVLKFDNRPEALEWLKNEVGKDDWVLVKGSRSMKMDEIAAGIIEHLKYGEES